MKLKIKSKLILWICVFALMIGSFSVSAFAAGTGIEIKQTKNLIVGDSKPLILSSVPATALLPEVTWSSDNEDVAIVDERGIVTGVSAGSAIITATSKEDSSVTASVKILVRSVYNYNVGWKGSFSSVDNNTTTTADVPVDSNRIEKKWDARVGNSTIVIVDEYIYTYDGTDKSGSTNNQGILYKINKETGEIVDQLTCEMSNSNYYSYIIYGGGLIYVSGINKVMAVDPDSFSVLWYSDVPYAFYQTLQFVNNHVVSRGAVLNSTTGEQEATLSGTYNYSSGVEKNGFYYIASNEGKLYAFDAESWQEKDSIAFRNSSGSFQNGVMYYKGRLYWNDCVSGNMCSVKIDDETGLFIDDSLIIRDCGIKSVCVPVAAGDRVYLAGQKDNSGAVGVFNASTLNLIYVANGATKNIYSTPILRVVSADGPSIASIQSKLSQTLAYGNYLILQDFGDSSGSRLFVLNDDSSKTSGSLKSLERITPAEFAYEQLAFDKDGSLYCTNDAGYLVKYKNATVSKPKITTDLLTTEMKYNVGDDSAMLIISAESVDDGTLTYQWQSRIDGSDWNNLIGCTKNFYSPSTETSGTTYYRCIVTNTLNGQTATTDSKVAKITVIGKEPVIPEPSVLYGDVNNDGKVDAKDVTTLRRHLADWDGYKVIETAVADVNLDNEVNAKDATNLARYLADWPGVTIGK